MRILLLLVTLLSGFNASAVTVRFVTDYGNIDIEMKDTEAPQTVENFLNYVSDGRYDESLFHRTSGGFNQIKFVQGGEFYVRNNEVDFIPADDPVDNEFSLSNRRATIAMAKLNNQPNSASKSFFFNLANNSALFDSQNGGYTVFGEVISGLEILDLIGSLVTVTETPLVNYVQNTTAGLDNYVYIRKAFILSESFHINEGISGAWVDPDTSGQGAYFEVLPSANVIIMAWFTFDAADPDEGIPNTIGDASNRWLTASGTYDGNLFQGTLFKTSGGLFDNPQTVSTTAVGTVTIQFNGCSTAVMTYVLTDSNLASTIPLQRVSGVNVDFCEQLAIDQNPGVSTQ